MWVIVARVGCLHVLSEDGRTAAGTPEVACLGLLPCGFDCSCFCPFASIKNKSGCSTLPGRCGHGEHRGSEEAPCSKPPETLSTL